MKAVISGDVSIPLTTAERQRIGQRRTLAVGRFSDKSVSSLVIKSRDLSSHGIFCVDEVKFNARNLL